MRAGRSSRRYGAKLYRSNVWCVQQSGHTVLWLSLRQRLHSEFSTTLARLDLMAQLERCPDGLKLNVLSNRLMVTGRNITRITDTLEKEGWVARAVEPKDRRVFRVTLTATGPGLFKRMAAAHARWIIDLFEGIPLKTRENLAELLRELKSHVRQHIDIDREGT